MTLREKQSKFAKMTVLLFGYIDLLGYEWTYGDTYRDPRCPYGADTSLHRSRLAIDVNLFIDGQWQQSSEAYEMLGEFWEMLGGSWGGRFSSPDGNHFSLEHEGRR